MVYDNEVLGINISEYLQEDKKGVTYVSKKNLCTLKMKKNGVSNDTAFAIS